MADKDGFKISKDFHLDIKPVNDGFHVKGLNHCDWGMKNRLSKIFNKTSGNTVMLAFDHGYIMGSTSGLERLDIVIPPLMEEVDVLMATRGALRTCITPIQDKAICLRSTYDSTVMYDDMSIGGGVATDIESAVRMNASCMAVQTFIGAPGEKNSLELLCRSVDAGERYGIPTLGVVAVGKDMVRDNKFFSLATRVVAESGAHIVKSYYCEGFEKIVASCPVPIVIAGGKKVPEAEALTMAYKAISEGACGVDMGRNIFQAENPKAMAKAVAKIVHENFSDKLAYEFYLDMK